jgi:hypothetical protein
VLAQFGVIAPALFLVTVFCTWTEALLFVPQLRANAVGSLVGSSVMYLAVAAALAVLAVALRLTRPSERVAHHRPAPVTAALIVACGVAYALYYLVFGAITYQYFTRDFYPDATQQVAALGGWFWALQIGRGMLMTIGVLPVVYTLRTTRWQAALVVGTLLWVAGGLAPLLVPNDLMSTPQRLIHIVEIFTQNAPLGITVVMLVRPGAHRGTLPTASPAGAG